MKKGITECKKCNSIVRFKEEDTFWDESGYMYSTKLVKCPHCGNYLILGYESDCWLQTHCNYYKYENKRRTKKKWNK